MKRHILAILALALFSGACAENNMSIQVLRARPFEDDCTIVPGDLAVGRGFFDISYADPAQAATGQFTTDYVQGFEIENNLYDTTDESSARLNAQNFKTVQAVVTYSSDDPLIQGTANGVPETVTPVALTVEADGGKHGIAATLLPKSIATLFTGGLADPTQTATLVASFRVEGELQDGWNLRSGTFDFPVELCNGCLRQTCPDLDADGTLDDPTFTCAFGHRPFTCGTN